MRPDRAHQLDVRRGLDPALGDQHHVVRQHRSDHRRQRHVDVERPQIAVVDPEQRGARGERDLRLAHGVDLDQRVELIGLRRGEQLGELRRRERGHDQEHRIRTRRARLGHLVAIDQEVLAQERQAHALADPREEGQIAVEVLAIGEHGDRRGPSLRVRRRDHRRIRARTDRTCRGRCTLDLGQHAHRLARGPRERRVQAPHRPGSPGAGLEIRQRHAALRGHQLLALGREDGVEDVRAGGHSTP